MKKLLILTTAAVGLAGGATVAVAEQGAIGAASSFHGKALGKDWGGAVSAVSKATNSGMADGDESISVPHAAGALAVSDPGVGNTGGARNNGKEE